VAKSQILRVTSSEAETNFASVQQKLRIIILSSHNRKHARYEREREREVKCEWREGWICDFVTYLSRAKR
jgi:hypothetical protein